jgi:hypothetical protein
MFHVCFKGDFFSFLILKDVFKVKPGANFTRIGWQQKKNEKRNKFCLFEISVWFG